MDALVARLVGFEELIERNAPMEEVLPSIYYSHLDKYKRFIIYADYVKKCMIL